MIEIKKSYPHPSWTAKAIFNKLVKDESLTNSLPPIDNLTLQVSNYNIALELQRLLMRTTDTRRIHRIDIQVNSNQDPNRVARNVHQLIREVCDPNYSKPWNRAKRWMINSYRKILRACGAKYV